MYVTKILCTKVRAGEQYVHKNQHVLHTHDHLQKSLFYHISIFYVDMFIIQVFFLSLKYKNLKALWLTIIFLHWATARLSSMLSP